MVILEPHFFAAFCANDAALEIADILPRNDLVDELRELLDVQHDLFMHIIENRHYGSDNIDKFMQHSNDIIAQVNCLKQKSIQRE